MLLSQASFGQIRILCIVLGLTALWKGVNPFLEDWNIFDNEAISFVIRSTLGQQRFDAVRRWHRPLLIARSICGLLLICGVAVGLASLFLFCALVSELKWRERSNHRFAVLVALALGVTCSPIQTVRGVGVLQHTSAWGLMALRLLLIDLYANSAYLKLKSSTFRSGRELAVTLDAVSRTSEFWCSVRRLVRRLGQERSAALFRTLAVSTILSEALLPIVLVTHRSFALCFALGLGLHAALCALLPKRILFFQLLPLSIYPLFYSPYIWSSLR